jgi:hypothetical protein
MRQLTTGWRRWTYRGCHRKPSNRVGHLATGLALFYAVYLQ